MLMQRLNRNIITAFSCVIAFTLMLVIGFNLQGSAIAGVTFGTLHVLNRPDIMALCLLSGGISTHFRNHGIFVLPLACCFTLLMGLMIGLGFVDNKAMIYVSILAIIIVVGALSVVRSWKYIAVTLVIAATAFYSGVIVSIELPDYASARYFLMGMFFVILLITACGVCLGFAIADTHEIMKAQLQELIQQSDSESQSFISAVKKQLYSPV